MATQQELVNELQSKLDSDALNDDEAIDLTRRILDHEKPVRNESRAARGLLGILNWASRCRRQRAYRRKSRGFTGIVIVSEGDSWFQYPKFLTDIIDYLRENKEYNIYSLGFGADWLANMLVKKEYEQVLKDEKPQVFLISGGGNDLVDHSRLASLVHEQSADRDKNPEKYRQCCPGKVAPSDGKSRPFNVLWPVLPGNDLKSRGRKWSPERSIRTRHNEG